MGGSILLEVYLFINPLSPKCLSSEKNIINLVHHLSEDVSFQFIPLLNMQIVSDTMIQLSLNKNDLATRNRQFQLHYNIILDYKAALFQGKKKGREFLMALQDQIMNNTQPYSEELAVSVANQVGLDLDMFKEDRRSDLAKRAFHADQKLAAEMKVVHSPSAVIYNYEVSDYGLLLEDVSYEALLDVCEQQGITVHAPVHSVPADAGTGKSFPNLRSL
ncbi:DsbA family protein [Levilactobacillus bambusae]|uniref:Dithiol-disulfide isomerase n=1 Tax=Levilactobacillus bambusae TaxID=2024736 RepID=A0A2V1N024_9LACO|nr:DsbA family protein [Levilactobacillus bambusae]PWG00621.1 dithiol-disulfide isomerase [Levilactobacillus bambusae]